MAVIWLPATLLQVLNPAQQSAKPCAATLGCRQDADGSLERSIGNLQPAISLIRFRKVYHRRQPIELTYMQQLYPGSMVRPLHEEKQ